HVSDTGCGIPKENQPRIWAPFFTTKLEAGTGLGLSISRDIVARAGGDIRVESPILETLDGPRGARFVISLPLAGDATSVSRPPGVAASDAARCFPPRRVLIVDDEEALARALATEVGRHHEVAVAYGAESALELLSEARFDAVLCDLRMPGVSGEALYERVRERDPDQARCFIFMSGIGFAPEVEKFLARSGCRLLQKPFDPARALEAIAQATGPQPET